MSGQKNESTATILPEPNYHFVELNFYTEYIYQRPGFTIDSIGVKCFANQQSSTSMWLFNNYRYDGLLFNTNDVNYYIIQHNDNGYDTNVVLHSYGTGDFDLYVKKDAYPTASVYDKRGYSPYGDEVIRLTSSDPPGTYYIAVPSYTGSGQYSIRMSYSKANERYKIKVGTEFAATTSQINFIYNTVKEGIKRFYGVTMGNIYVYEADIYNSGLNQNCSCTEEFNFTCMCGDSVCDICFKQGSNRARASLGGKKRFSILTEGT